MWKTHKLVMNHETITPVPSVKYCSTKSKTNCSYRVIYSNSCIASNAVCSIVQDPYNKNY